MNWHLGVSVARIDCRGALYSRAVTVRAVVVRVVAVLELPPAVRLRSMLLAASVARARARRACKTYGAVTSFRNCGTRGQVRCFHQLAKVSSVSEHQGVGNINAVVERGRLRTLSLRSHARAVTVPSRV